MLARCSEDFQTSHSLESLVWRPNFDKVMCSMRRVSRLEADEHISDHGELGQEKAAQ